VGGEPDQFGVSPPAFHRQNAERRERWPDGMTATATHDTKRGEDVRARISVLSEIPAEWRGKLVRWGRQSGFESRFFDRRTERYLISSVAVYGGQAGARAYLDAIFRSPPAPKGLRELPAGQRVGQDMRLYVQYTTQLGTRLQFLYLAWRERNVIAAIALGGLRGRVTADQARAFGRLQQVRIRRALAAS
jgi:hypothetical protein